jgi:hypothetical protein
MTVPLFKPIGDQLILSFEIDPPYLVTELQVLAIFLP